MSFNSLTVIDATRTNVLDLGTDRDPTKSLFGLDHSSSGEAYIIDDGVNSLNLNTHLDYRYNTGSISAKGKIDQSGIEITIKPSFGDGFLGYYCVLRGKFEYKYTNSQFNALVVHEAYGFDADEITFVDTQVTPGDHYYYTLIPAFGDTKETAYNLMNPNTNKSSAYRYKDCGHSSFMYSQIPNGVREQAIREGGEENPTKRYLSIVGKVFDSIKTDIDAYIGKATNVWAVHIDQIDHLASRLNWVTNKELTGIGRRLEVEKVIDVYKKKGTLQGVEELLGLVTGFNVNYEYGENRLLVSNTIGRSIDWSQEYNQDKPPSFVSSEVIGTSTGTSGQTFPLNANAVRVVLYTDDFWLQVEDLADYGPTDRVYTFSGGIVTFGNNVNGLIPENTDTITVDYQIEGDTSYYSVGYVDDWKNRLGVRAVIDASDFTGVLDKDILFKINKVFQQFKPLYLRVELIIIAPTNIDGVSIDADTISMLEAEFSDIVTSITLLKFDSTGHTFDSTDKKIG